MSICVSSLMEPSTLPWALFLRYKISNRLHDCMRSTNWARKKHSVDLFCGWGNFYNLPFATTRVGPGLKRERGSLKRTTYVGIRVRAAGKAGKEMTQPKNFLILEKGLLVPFLDLFSVYICICPATF